MAFRKVTQLTGWHGVATVARCADPAEYRVRFVPTDGGEPGEYFTDDKSDALGTARVMAGPELGPCDIGLPEGLAQAQRDADRYGIPQVVYRGPNTCGWTSLAFTSDAARARGCEMHVTLLNANYFS
jgi:hypothetical protein